MPANVGRTARIVARGTTIALAACLLGCKPKVTTITVTPGAASVHSTESTSVTANVSVSGNPVTTAIVNFASGSAAGTVAPARANADAVGDAVTTFTGAAVTQDTPVTVSATSPPATTTGTTTITVKPPKGFDDFGGAGTGTTVANAEIVVAPSVVPGAGPNGTLLLTYVVTLANANVPVVNFTINFARPVTITAPAGGMSANGGRVWLIRWPAGSPKPVTLTVIGNTDGSPGGTAAFDFTDNPPNVRHARISVAGPVP